MKTNNRRRFLRLAAGAIALPAIPRAAWSQDRALPYPTRPVRLVLGFAAGGSVDIVARLIGQWLSERHAQPWVIENRGGAAGNIATEAVSKAAPDGYTLLLATAANAVNASLHDKLNFDFMADFAPVAGIATMPLAMVVHPSFPAKSVSEFIAHAKANPSKINFASGGAGGPSHLAGELFKMRAGISMEHVPFRGNSPAIAGLLGDHVQVLFPAIPVAFEYINTGRLRALAVTGKARSQAIPQIPTMAELFPDFEASQWFGVAAPRNTPSGIVEKLNKEINAALNDAKIQKRLLERGGTPLTGTPAEFGKLIADETEKWGKVIRAANIKPE
jgi:tripartite-type tricarboxylate transporter receptor subunit TctC